MASISLKNKRTVQLAKQDSDAAQRERHAQRKAWFAAEQQRQAANRYQMALDEDYYDGLQWTPQEAAVVRSRGQNPVVWNEVAPTLNWMIGTAEKTQTDFVVMNRSEQSEEAGNDAQVKTQLLKYLDDVNNTSSERIEAFKDSIIAGIGYIDVGINPDPTDEAVYGRHESWRHVLHDSLGTRRDWDDSRYLFRFKQVDLDWAVAYFPGKEDLLRKACIEASSSGMWDWREGHPWMGAIDPTMPAKYMMFDASGWVAHPRRRLTLLEAWTNDPFTANPSRPEGTGLESLVQMRKRVAVMTEFDDLAETWSPFRHNRFPLVPVWCYRRRRDGQPYGMVRNIRGQQDMLNKQMSKAQFRLSARQIMLEQGALNPELMDKEELRDEIAAPDGIMEFASGAVASGKVKIIEGAALAEADIRLAAHNTESIRTVSGISGENRGMDTNVTSGKGILAKQDQGSMITSEPFANLRFARQIEGQITLSLCEQYYTEPKTFGVAGERGQPKYHSINQQQPDGSVLNDITKRQASFVLGEQPWQTSLAAAAFEQTMTMLGQLAGVAPQVVISLLDLTFELYPNLPNKQAFLDRIRKATGQAGPDGKLTPEQQQAQAQQAQLAQAQFQAKLSELQATIKEAQAKGEKLEADALNVRLEALYVAAQAAQVLAVDPHIAPVADELLDSAGFVDQSSAHDPIQVPADASANSMQQGAPSPLHPGAGPLVGHLAGHEVGMRPIAGDPAAAPQPQQ